MLLARSAYEDTLITNPDKAVSISLFTTIVVVSVRQMSVVCRIAVLLLLTSYTLAMPIVDSEPGKRHSKAMQQCVRKGYISLERTLYCFHTIDKSPYVVLNLAL